MDDLGNDPAKDKLITTTPLTQQPRPTEVATDQLLTNTALQSPEPSQEPWESVFQHTRKAFQGVGDDARGLPGSEEASGAQWAGVPYAPDVTGADATAPWVSPVTQSWSPSTGGTAIRNSQNQSLHTQSSNFLRNGSPQSVIPNTQRTTGPIVDRAPNTQPQSFFSANPDPGAIEHLRETVANGAIGHMLDRNAPDLGKWLRLLPTENSGSPEYEEHGNQLLPLEYMAPYLQPNVSPNSLQGRTHSLGVGIAKGTGELTSPENLAFIGATGGVGELGPMLEEAPAIARYMPAAAKGALMGWSGNKLINHWKDAWDQYRGGNTNEALETLGSTLPESALLANDIREGAMENNHDHAYESPHSNFQYDPAHPMSSPYRLTNLKPEYLGPDEIPRSLFEPGNHGVGHPRGLFDQPARPFGLLPEPSPLVSVPRPRSLPAGTLPKGLLGNGVGSNSLALLPTNSAR